MAFQQTSVAGIAPIGNPALRDLTQTLMRGYMAARMPKQIQQQEEQRELANQLSQLKISEEPERFRLAKALMQAQTEKALRPPQYAPSNFEKALAGAERIKNQFGENSPQSKLAQMYISRLAEGSGTQLTVDPSTGAVSFSSGARQRDGGQKVVDGKVISQLTKGAATDQQKIDLANKSRQVIAKNINMPYLGSGGLTRLAHEFFMYNLVKDPKEKEKYGNRLVDAAVAYKIAPEYALMQLTAQGARATVPAIHEQIQATTAGWPKFLKYFAGNLPPKLQKRAQDQHDKIISKIGYARKLYAAEGLPLDISNKNENVSRETKETKQKSEVPDIQETKQVSGKTYIKIDGEWYEP